ncbi:MAG: hypothetical protein ACLF0G_01340 [Candidatus Brocadiia bacterium]
MERVALALAVLAGPALAGELPVKPYVDPSQLEVPWPKHSHVKQPWRGFLETRPAADLLSGIGICYHHHGGSIEAQLGLLAEAGFRCLRWEQPLGSYDPEAKTIAPGQQKRYREVLRACGKLGITPIVLLNAHHGYPCAMKSWQRRVAREAPKGATELTLDSVEGFRPVHAGLANLTTYWAGEVLFTEIDRASRTVRLSKPLPKALEKGQQVHCVDLHYLPAHPVGTPQFEHLARGWVDYARAICAIAKEEGVGIEVEIWNELSFGSHFMGGHGINAYWPGHVEFEKDFLRPGGHAWEVSRRIIEMVERQFPGTRCIWGWSNTTFFHTPIEQLPPGTDGQSYHPYGTGWRKLPEREQAPHQPWRCLEGHCPDYRVCFAEGWAHTFIQCESLMHLLRPDKRLSRRPPGTEVFHHYITEHGIVPAEAGVEGEEESLRLKEKFLVRAILFWLNKGLSRITVFQSGPEKHNHGMGLMLARCRGLKAPPPSDEVEAWLSPALLALRRTVEVFEGAEPVERPRQFGVEVVKLGEERKVFEMPEGKPTLTYRELFALLPFQVSEGKFVFAVYVMSPTYPIEDLAEVTYRVTLRPLDGPRCSLRYYDPLADRDLAPRVVERRPEALTVEVPTIDTPRLLIVEEEGQ